MIGAQQPAAGGWSSTARQLNSLWGRVRLDATSHENKGEHSLELLVDADHYACVREARDRAESDIVLGCDLFGLAAETSVLVPIERAAELGRRISLFYQRPSKLLKAEERTPDTDTLGKRGLNLNCAESLHGKFLTWDGGDLFATSFNWLSTVAEGTRSRGAEIGIHVSARAFERCLSIKWWLVALQHCCKVRLDRPAWQTRKNVRMTARKLAVVRHHLPPHAVVATT
jgi:hypothetical protein